MRKIRSKDTKPEIALRKALWNLGYHYRVNVNSLPGKPDIVFRKKRIVIFIDGSFWHGYKWQEKKRSIKSNRDYWISKIEKNISRDIMITEILQKEGWIVLRFWDHQINTNLEGCLNETIKLLSFQ